MKTLDGFTNSDDYFYYRFMIEEIRLPLNKNYGNKQ